MKIKALFFFLALFQLSFGASDIGIAQLKTEMRNNPLGVDTPAPRFSWILTSNTRNEFQTAFEILVSDDEAILSKNTGNTWQSPKIQSNKTYGIEYFGKPLVSFKRYFWKVRVWDGRNVAGEWSSPAWFETSMLSDNDWKAKWISDQRPLPLNDSDLYNETPCPVLRREFPLKKELKTARLYITSGGYYLAHINGLPVSDNMLDPAWTNYSKQIMYRTFDITGLIHEGENAIGVMLGNGWYNPMPINLFRHCNLRDYLTIGKPCLKAQILLQYKDGSSETIITDDNWLSADGPVVKNSVYLGEMYDARLENDGWDTEGKDKTNWQKAKIVSGPAGKLIAAYIPPIRATRIVKPVRISEISPGKFIFDFGQNFAGVPKLKVSGPAGTKVILRSGECLYADGSLNINTVIAGQLKEMWKMNGGPGCPKDPSNIITYILKGAGEEIYTPQFTFSGFRYVEMTGFPGKPDLNTLEGLRMNTDLQETGSFECSDEMFNKLQEVTKWTFLSNVFSVQSDCPAREKFGYGGDIVTTAEAFSFNYDMSSFYSKVVQDFKNDVRPGGGLPEIAPFTGIASEGMGNGTGSPGWQLAFPFTLKVLYDYYGDSRIVDDKYITLKNQVDFMSAVTPSGIIEKDISDHESIDPKPVSLSATAFYYHHVKILVEFAALLHKESDVAEYNVLANEIKKAFVSAFLKKGTGVFDSGTQGAQIFALYYDLVPESEKPAAMDRLISEIVTKHNSHISTGIFGTKFMFDFLRRENRNDLAFTIASQPDFPGWGNMLANGATTLQESWKYSDITPSLNHPMFGSISEWYFKSILGLNATGPGFSTFVIKPQPAGDLNWAKGSYDAVTGRIESSWIIEGERFHLNVSIPVNTSALVCVPTSDLSSLKESGNPILPGNGIELVKFKDGYAEFEVKSGKYSFDSQY
jgi:alpha-L-rhamnosidase